jgi:hypothetical protein
MTSELDAWCYDDLQSRSWPNPNWSPSVERDGCVYWTIFDGNPAVFAGRILIQGWEDLLSAGAPPETTAPAALVQEVRQHLLASRRPGRSTQLIVGARAEVHGDPLWMLDGRLFAQPYLDGPGTSGAITDDRVSWRRARGNSWSRILVSPGTHEITGQLSTPVRRTVNVSLGERVEVLF